MPSFEYTIDEKSRVGARFLSRVKEEIQRAFSIEKRERKLTQQSVAQKLGVNRSVVNRQLMGYENMTTRSIAEMLWAIGWEPHFEVRPIEHALGNQKAPAASWKTQGQKPLPDLSAPFCPFCGERICHPIALRRAAQPIWSL